ncbi:hypothetical protein GXB81_14870 [Paraburkholderia sp. Ac-20336]|uniref:hypothetical protein n=1 Tax=unclassified Paraburkholderia TaxID=2615204 RepID=UPI0014239DB0|nr:MULTISPECIES: hypothetical protein [unclassified Paraburkholderia]MBN3804324.1 hypothetical protein [Paraburkholderia sp. Ac-20336]MBN3850109.1 hypothetical protein [Paraburkholderia sp. Ac-20342]
MLASLQAWDCQKNKKSCKAQNLYIPMDAPGRFDGPLYRGPVAGYEPGEAREAARRESELQDRKGDSLTTVAVRKVKRSQVAKATRGIPTLRGYLEDTCLAELRTSCKTANHGDANVQIILQSFPDFLDLPLDHLPAAPLYGVAQRIAQGGSVTGVAVAHGALFRGQVRPKTTRPALRGP